MNRLVAKYRPASGAFASVVVLVWGYADLKVARANKDSSVSAQGPWRNVWLRSFRRRVTRRCTMRSLGYALKYMGREYRAVGIKRSPTPAQSATPLHKIVQAQFLKQPPYFRRKQPAQPFVPLAELLRQPEVGTTHLEPSSCHRGFVFVTPRFQLLDWDLMFQTEAEGVFCDPLGMPCGVDRKRGQSARCCEVAFGVGGNDCGDDGTE